jgi:hypothetical protein
VAFTIPEGLHEELYPFAWMIGKWGGTGVGDYPGVPQFTFEQEIVFDHDGRNFMTYSSKSWIVDENNKRVRPAASEVGFWRPKPKNVLEVVISHNTGISEGWVGIYDGPKVQLVMDQGISTPTAKIVTEGQRLYGLVEGQLFTSYDMAAEGKTLQAHIWSTLERQVNV